MKRMDLRPNRYRGGATRSTILIFLGFYALVGTGACAWSLTRKILQANKPDIYSIESACYTVDSKPLLVKKLGRIQLQDSSSVALFHLKTQEAADALVRSCGGRMLGAPQMLTSGSTPAEIKIADNKNSSLVLHIAMIPGDPMAYNLHMKASLPSGTHSLDQFEATARPADDANHFYSEASCILIPSQGSAQLLIVNTFSIVPRA